MINTSVKKIIVTVVSAAAVIAVAITFGILCNLESNGFNNYGETFTGYISENAYPSRESAAQAFVKEQLSGAYESPVYTDCKVLNEMSTAEIDKLNAPSLQSARSATKYITGGDNCEITYEVDGNKRRIKADILYTDEIECLYRARLPENGEQPTKAYLDSVFDGEKYLNCTSTSRFGITVMSIYNTYMQTIKFADDCAYFNQELPGFLNEVYLREYDDGVTVFLKNPAGKGDDNFYTVSEINAMLFKDGLKLAPLYLTKGAMQVNIDSLKSMRDVTDFVFLMPIDCSFFTKTENGFSMTADKYKAVCTALAGEDFAEEFDKFWHDYKVNFHADYYVTDGRLSRVQTVLQMAYDGDLMSIMMTTDYTDFGSTKVTVPHD